MRFTSSALATFVAATFAFAIPANAQDYDYDYYGDDWISFWEDGEYKTEEAEDVEFEVGEGYHEEEWYDPGDWFDTGEGVSYETDYDDDNYGAGYYDDSYYDDDWYYDYYDDDYDYYDTY